MSVKLNKEGIIKKLKELYGEYDFSISDNEVSFTCKKHGVITRSVRDILYARNGHTPCVKCNKNIGGKKRNPVNWTERLIEASKTTRYIYDLTQVEEKTQKDTILVTCPIHNFSKQQQLQNASNARKISCCLEPQLTLKEIEEKLIGYKWEIIGDFKGTQTKIKVTCGEHGDSFITGKRLRRYTSGLICRRCAYQQNADTFHKYNLEQWVELAHKAHNNYYDYSKVTIEDISRDSKATIICPKHGEFKQLFSNHIHLGNKCPKCANIVTKPMQEMISFFEGLGFIKEQDFFVNYRKLISPLEVDFYFPYLKVAFEFNGSKWHSSPFKSKYYHRDKKDRCEKLGVNLVHIFDFEWLHKLEIVQSRIKSILGKSEVTYYARKLQIQEVTKETSSNFLATYHLQGDCVDLYRYGLFDKEMLVALMTFGKPRFDKECDWELIRYVSVGNVIGGASRLLKHFESKHTGSILSYANRNWTSQEHNLYLTLGFTLSHKSLPNYTWVNLSRTLSILSRYKCQKSNLKKLFPNSEGTEKEIMESQNYLQVFDCGNLVFTKKKPPSTKGT